MFNRLTGLLKLKTAMLLAILVIAAGGAYLYQKRAEIKDDLRQLEAGRTTVMGDLDAMTAETARLSEALDLKEEELARAQEKLQSEDGGQVETRDLSTLAQALDLSADLIKFATERGVAFTTFEYIPTTVDVGALELRAQHYSLVAMGPSESLLAMLRKVAEVKSAKINALELERASDDVTLWVMVLDVTVVYDEG